MSQKITHIDLGKDNPAEIENYNKKARSNLDLFGTVLRPDFEERFKRLGLQKTTGENNRLLQKLSYLTGISSETIEAVNAADELLGVSFIENFGCTSIGKDGVIGQTMDLFTVDLCVVREGKTVYVTMPPYLALMGMNDKIAFCTNYLPSQVEKGVPIAHLRRDILRQKSIEEVINYFNSVGRAAQVNFLVTDGTRIVDLEVFPEELRIHESINNYFAHTNHVLNRDIRKDNSCPRLRRAVKLLNESAGIEKILDDKQVTIPISTFSTIGFGSIVKVVMNVREQEFLYKEPEASKYVKIKL